MYIEKVFLDITQRETIGRGAFVSHDFVCSKGHFSISLIVMMKNQEVSSKVLRTSQFLVF